MLKRRLRRIYNGTASFLFGLLMLVGGVALAAWTWHAYQSRSWTEHQCRVVSTDKYRETSEGKNESTVAVHYEYVVGEETYQGEDEKTLHSDAARRLTVEDWRSGKTIPCWYSPDDPSQSYVVRPGIFGTVVAFGFALVLVGVGAIAVSDDLQTFLRRLTRRPGPPRRPAAHGRPER